ncbi:hypothetical protein NL676_039809 [Syzygium grande]|nr:hypothetical protein NL676_039809 [Syzygium grande]
METGLGFLPHLDPTRLCTFADPTPVSALAFVALHLPRPPSNARATVVSPPWSDPSATPPPGLDGDDRDEWRRPSRSGDANTTRMGAAFAKNGLCVTAIRRVVLPTKTDA